MSTRCGICESERAPIINSLLAAGRSPHWIEGEMKRLGSPTKYETVKRHLDKCLNGDPANSALLEKAASGQTITNNTDFAAAVRREANRLLAEGKLHVRTADGLTAQALLDRRAEKAADRNLMLQVAQLLSGAQSGQPEVIVGQWTEVTESDNADADGLAPLALVSSE